MKFKIELVDRTVIYANDICISGALQTLGIWDAGQCIDSIDLSHIRFIWVLDPIDPVGNILIYL